VDFAESTEHRALRAAVAQIANDFGPRYYAERAAERRPCAELWKALGEAGFIGVNIPEAYGGGGGGLAELVLVCEEIAAAGTPLLLLVVSAAISAEVICEFGTEEQRKTWLPGLASGAAKMVFAITEPDAGSNTHRLSTTAVRDGEDWVLSGTKYYISGVDEAEALLVVAKTSPDALSLFIVRTDAAGLDKHLLPVDLLLPERQFTLHFDDVRVGPGGRRRPVRADRRGPVRQRAHDLVRADRRSPGPGAPAGQGQDRDRARGPDDQAGRLAARPRPARGGVVQYG